MLGDLNLNARGTAWLVDGAGNARAMSVRFDEGEDTTDPLGSRLVIEHPETVGLGRVELRLADVAAFLGELVGIDVLGMLGTIVGPLG